MAVAIDTARLALDYIPHMQRRLDHKNGGGSCFQIHRVSAYATILPHDPKIWRRQQDSPAKRTKYFISSALIGALKWQADPDDDLGDAEVLHHLHQQAATVPCLSNAISQSDHGNDATTLTGSALSPSINAKTQGRLLSSFHRHSYRLSRLVQKNRQYGISQMDFGFGDTFNNLSDSIVWAVPRKNDYDVFWQLQIEVVDLLSRRAQVPTFHPGKRRRTTFNQFLQLSHSPVLGDTSRGDPLPHARRFNGVRHRPDRKIWVAEMKPPKHNTKQDFGNFKSEAEAARAVDAAFHHYGRPHLLNFPDTSLQFLSKRSKAPPGLDEKAKVIFVREEAKLLVAAIAPASPLHPTHTNSLQILELSASPRRCPSSQFRSFSEISSPFNCSDSDEVDDVVSQPQPWLLLDSISDISTTGVLTNLETLNSVQSEEQGWDWSENSTTLAAAPNVVNPSACMMQSMWLDSVIRSPPAPPYSRSPSPSHFQEEIAYALLEQQSI